ncbi:MAG: GtrA family protein [Kocuria sp.]|nr:GtrA family protein [Kocuria sp.]
MSGWKQKATALHKQYGRHIRFLIVGGTCFVLTVLMNFALKWTVLSNNPTTSMIVATTTASVVSYYLNKKWTFSEQGKHRSGVEMVLFALVCALGIVINSAPVYISRYVIGLETPAYSLLVQETADFIAGPILGTAFAMVFRWWAMDTFVFPRTDREISTDRTNSHDHTPQIATVALLNTAGVPRQPVPVDTGVQRLSA